MNIQHHHTNFGSYSNLQKQLDEEHKRLLRQREQILSKESQKLQLYQKIDLVEFFNYEPSQSESSKKQMMYHLTEKFKQYMKNLTQNNVYKQMGHQVNGNSQRQRSVSKSKGKTNVYKNSDLGRMFQTQKLYENRNQSNTLLQSMNQENQNSFRISRVCEETQRKSSGELFQNPQLRLKKKLFEEERKSQQGSYLKKDTLTVKKDTNRQNTQRKFPPTIQQPHSKQQVLFSAQQLSHALDQQQKIYLLTQLNYYIKLYKESQTKKQFMSTHLENLHEYLVDVRLKYEAKNKNKGKIQEYKSYSLLVQENQVLKKQIETYKRQIKALNRMEKEDFYDSFHENHNKISKKCIQVKKIDRFKEFASHIQIMQQQLSNLIKSNTLSKIQVENQNQSIINDLENKVRQLEEFIEKENQKKEMFFEEVKRFKEIMNRKDQEIYSLKERLIINKKKMDQDMILNQQKHESILGVRNFNESNNIYTERSKSKTKYSSPRKITNIQKQNEIFDRKDQFDRFIDSALKNTDNQQSQKSFRYSRVTTKEPSETGLKPSQFSSNYRTSIPYQNSNEIKFDEKSNHGSRTTYHSRMIDPSANLTSRQRNTSKSKSHYSSKSNSRSRSKTNYFDEYEPRPYERYNNLSEYSAITNLYPKLLTETNPLYSRISDTHRDYSKSQLGYNV